MDVETRTMTVVKNVIEAAGGKVLSIVFDGIYTLAESHEHLHSVFNTTTV